MTFQLLSQITKKMIVCSMHTLRRCPVFWAPALGIACEGWL
jgi:hypothetical protein